MTYETERTTAFQLQLPVFEGPLDLLLYLIERQELDITAVSLVQVTDQYLSYLRSGEQIDATALAEFIATGARLLLLKSRALLPKPPVEEEPEEDLGEELVRRLREYRRFKEVAGALRDIEESGRHAYPRQAPPPSVPLPTGLDGVTLDLLLQLFHVALEREPAAEPEGAIERREVAVDAKGAELSPGVPGRQAGRETRRVRWRGDEPQAGNTPAECRAGASVFGYRKLPVSVRIPVSRHSAISGVMSISLFAKRSSRIEHVAGDLTHTMRRSPSASCGMWWSTTIVRPHGSKYGATRPSRLAASRSRMIARLCRSEAGSIRMRSVPGRNSR